MPCHAYRQVNLSAGNTAKTVSQQRNHNQKRCGAFEILIE